VTGVLYAFLTPTLQEAAVQSEGPVTPLAAGATSTSTSTKLMLVPAHLTAAAIITVTRRLGQSPGRR
jgi:hypothetical protein